MPILNKNLTHRTQAVCRQFVGGLLQIPLLFVVSCFANEVAGANDNMPVDLPPPLGITTTASPPLVAVIPSPEVSIAASVPDAMRFISLGRVAFVSNKWELSDEAKRTLDSVSAYLAANPGTARLLLDGHTDSAGSIRYNDALSDKRAMAVQAYLSSKGLDTSLIRWKGQGKRAPIDENWTRLGRDRNRQVELYAVYPPQP